jgi:alpha-ketoglutarate-dependent taurine dioxygenase
MLEAPLDLPLVITKGDLAEHPLNGLSIADRDAIERSLVTHGAILFRGFEITSARDFRSLLTALVGEPITYVERSSPRKHVEEQVYTSTEYPADRAILLHNEQSYNLRFPRYIAFCCETPSARGGATPLADTRRVLRRIDPGIRDDLSHAGYCYIRNFGGPLQMSWQHAFGVSDADSLVRYCLDSDIEIQWPDGSGGKRARTLQKRPVIAKHPTSGELAWFNHLTFFHSSSLDRDLRRIIEECTGKSGMPHATVRGDDGGVIPDEVVTHLRHAYESEQRCFDWQRGDVLIVENMIVAHGRQAYTGPRSILAAMTQLCHWETVAGAKS